VRLIAGLPGIPGYYLTDNHPPFSPERVNLIALLGTGIYDFSATINKLVYPSNFPYGFAVDPDR
jgi:hypothetical protein